MIEESYFFVTLFPECFLWYCPSLFHFVLIYFNLLIIVIYFCDSFQFIIHVVEVFVCFNIFSCWFL